MFLNKLRSALALHENYIVVMIHNEIDTPKTTLLQNFLGNDHKLLFHNLSCKAEMHAVCSEKSQIIYQKREKIQKFTTPEWSLPPHSKSMPSERALAVAYLPKNNKKIEH